MTFNVDLKVTEMPSTNCIYVQLTRDLFAIGKFLLYFLRSKRKNKKLSCRREAARCSASTLAYMTDANKIP